MRNKKEYTIDRDTRTLLLKYLRKYDDYVTWLDAERERLLHPSRAGDGQPRGNAPCNPTLGVVVSLEALESTHKAKVVNAIDHARNLLAIEIMDDHAREAIRRAIWLSCLNPDEYPFEAFAGAIPTERRTFYRWKNMFLNDIKNFLGL